VPFVARGVATVGGSLVVSRLLSKCSADVRCAVIAGARANSRHLPSLGIAFDIVDRLSVSSYCILLML
jgi:hypothetical protein